VLSNNDGCVIARSADAKPYVKMGEPYFQINDKLHKHGIDEAFAELTGMPGDLERLGRRFERTSIDEQAFQSA
jgi:DNA polymerase V